MSSCVYRARVRRKGRRRAATPQAAPAKERKPNAVGPASGTSARRQNVPQEFASPPRQALSQLRQARTRQKRSWTRQRPAGFRPSKIICAARNSEPRLALGCAEFFRASAEILQIAAVFRKRSYELAKLAADVRMAWNTGFSEPFG